MYDWYSRGSEPNRSSERCGEDCHDPYLHQLSRKPDWCSGNHLRYSHYPGSCCLDGVQRVTYPFELEILAQQFETGGA